MQIILRHNMYKSIIDFGFGSFLTLGLSIGCLNWAHAKTPLLEHVAVYDVSLKEADERTGLSSMNGLIAYDFQGSQCDGYTTNFRFVVKVVNGDNEFVSDQRATTYESSDGKNYSFSDRSFLNNQLESELKGNAKQIDDGLKVNLSIPKDLEVKLGSAIFPTAHIEKIIEKALAGESFYKTKIYDAADDGDKIMLSTTIIGKSRTDVSEDNKEFAVLEDMKDKPYWPVNIAYFDSIDHKSEALPTYQISFKLYENGVTRDLILDYGDYSLKALLKNLKVLPATKCYRD
jgi:hypothetical protein